mmetsp:Transcript_24560/g.59219  ORF Transcript_24560/g.59219 Transcript_24560/m.59219 type:complete len:298 (-) Transcript_24560:583-1476(-)
MYQIVNMLCQEKCGSPYNISIHRTYAIFMLCLSYDRAAMDTAKRRSHRCYRSFIPNQFHRSEPSNRSLNCRRVPASILRARPLEDSRFWPTSSTLPSPSALTMEAASSELTPFSAFRLSFSFLPLFSSLLLPFSSLFLSLSSFSLFFRSTLSSLSFIFSAFFMAFDSSLGSRRMDRTSASSFDAIEDKSMPSPAEPEVPLFRSRKRLSNARFVAQLFSSMRRYMRIVISSSSDDFSFFLPFLFFFSFLPSFSFSSLRTSSQTSLTIWPSYFSQISSHDMLDDVPGPTNRPLSLRLRY